MLLLSCTPKSSKGLQRKHVGGSPASVSTADTDVCDEWFDARSCASREECSDGEPPNGECSDTAPGGELPLEVDAPTPGCRRLPQEPLLLPLVLRRDAVADEHEPEEEPGACAGPRRPEREEVGMDTPSSLGYSPARRAPCTFSIPPLDELLVSCSAEHIAQCLLGQPPDQVEALLALMGSPLPPEEVVAAMQALSSTARAREASGDSDEAPDGAPEEGC